MSREFTNGLKTDSLQVTGGTPTSGKVLTSDASGNATWQTAAGGSTNYINSLYYAQSNLTGSGLPTLTGSVNGSNTSFTVPEGVYISGSLQVYLNGVLQVLGDAITQTTPASGIFTFATAPVTGDQISVVYQKYNATSTGLAPNGTDGSIQIYNGGEFSSDADLTWLAASGTLALSGTDNGISFQSIIAEPTAPAAGTGRLYAKTIAGRVMPKWIGPSGVDYPLQAHFGLNNVRLWRGGATTTATTFASTLGSMPYTGASPTAPTIPALATTNLLTQTVRSTLSTGATAGGIAYIRGNQLTVTRGNAANIGGFMVIHRFALSGTLQSGIRAFVGLVDVTSNPTNVDPTTTATPGGVGIAINANSGNWKFVSNLSGTARTSVDLGSIIAVNNTDPIELVIYSRPNATQIGYRVTNLTTGSSTSSVTGSNIPSNTTFLAPVAWITNNATAAAQTFDFISTYVETDY